MKRHELHHKNRTASKQAGSETTPSDSLFSASVQESKQGPVSRKNGIKKCKSSSFYLGDDDEEVDDSNSSSSESSSTERHQMMD